MRFLHRGLIVAALCLALCACAAAMLSRTPGSQPARSSDAAITASIQDRLAGEPGLAAGSVVVTTQQGIVTLQGQVPGDAERRRAEQLARTVSGVRAVRNELAVR